MVDILPDLKRQLAVSLCPDTDMSWSGEERRVSCNYDLEDKEEENQFLLRP